MKKVKILYESELGRDGDSHVVIENATTLELLVGATMIVSHISKSVARRIGVEQQDVVLQIFGSIMNGMLKEKEKKSE